MSDSKRTVLIYKEMARLKLCNKDNGPVRFLLEKSPFNDDDDDDDDACKSVDSKECSAIGQIFPISEMYKDAAYRIEIKLSTTYPLTPPEIKFLTPIYHPNVDPESGVLCDASILTTATYTPKMSLVDIIEAVIKCIDEPNCDKPVRAALGVEYVNDRATFSNAQMEARKSGLPRT
ncbi:hypothetical protein I4U23_001855 [Adineta vaga]|nr:hypothetical protein I4U23_001855 [Adineta vaga]